VHQFVPALIPRDATGSHTLLLRDALRRAGLRSEIFAEATHDELLAESIPAERYPQVAAPGDVLVYQFSTSSMVAELLADRPEPLVIHYHNITGPEHYEAWEPDIARRAADARRQLRLLAPRAVLGLADSAFNEADLRAAGCGRTLVVPVLSDHGRLGVPPDPPTVAALAAGKAAGGADWLFVGRLVPSKAQHELVKALWVYRRLYDPRARLHLVGLPSSPPYARALAAFIDSLGLADAAVVHGEVSDAALAAHFAAADVFVCLSQHEGFGIPLLEAMGTGTPVVALDAGAVGSTLGDAGVVLAPAGALRVAAAVHRILGDPRLHAALVGAGRRRAGQLALATSTAVTVTALVDLVEQGRAGQPAPAGPPARAVTPATTSPTAGSGRR
jgi:glycosyltransferase involved in cell wall biosynthesis